MQSWVPLTELKRIGDALWPDSRPKGYIKHVAVRAGLSLILQLWTFIPYRSRNIREMQLEENLYRDHHGHWRIKFVGEQLKVSEKRGKTNIFDLPFPPALVPRLEEYMTVWRPLLETPSKPLTYLFVNRDGNPWSHPGLQRLVRTTVYRYTGKFFHPHIVRTIWATEWIKNTHGDFYTAAVMLNDTLEIVIKKYTYLLEEDVAEKAYRLIEQRNGHSK
jgi:integrase